MKKGIRIALWIAGALVAGFVGLFLFGLWAMSTSEYSFPRGDLATNITGRWAWASPSGSCGEKAHVISFSDDRKTMTITRPATASDTGSTAIYDIAIQSPSRIRGAIRGETRVTDDGKLVVWDLVMVSANEYHWHRTDWQPWGFTASVVRCGVAPDSVKR